MDRHRGSSTGYRNTSTSHYTSSDYSSRNFEQNQQNRRGRGSSSSHHGWSGERTYSAPKDYDRYSSSERGSKRKYESSSEHKKSYDHHGYDQDPPRKYHRSDGNHSFEGRSSHHPHQRSQYEQSSSSNRGRNNSYENGRPSSYDDDSYQRRYNENRRYQPRGAGSGSSSGHRGGGGYVSNRGRGRGRGANRSHGGGSHQHSKTTKDYQSERTEDSSSPNRMSLAEESACASDVPSVSPSHQPPENNEEEATDKVTAAQSESDKSTREGNVREKETSSDAKQEDSEATEDNAKKLDDDQQSKGEGDSGRKSETERSPKRKTASKEVPEHFIRLQCPHCNQRSITFRDYIVHLSSQRHAKSLEKVSLQHRMSLAKLRTRQRKEQLQIEAQSSRSSHSSRMNFCAICKLCHSESRPNHETTELHKIIKNFLMPNCPICRVNFKSRMLYEKHVATLTHIKNKVNMEKSYERRREEERKHGRNGIDKDELVLDLENFMTLDAVGSVDGDADNGVSLEESAVGQEYVKKVEAFFCEVCQRYLSRVEPLEKGLEFHCRTRSHHRALEERQNGHKVQGSEGRTEAEDIQDQAGHRGGLTRSESQELLLVEAENDLGEFCDLIGEDEQAPEEREDELAEEDRNDGADGKQKNKEEREGEESNSYQDFSAVRVKCEKE